MSKKIATQNEATIIKLLKAGAQLHYLQTANVFSTNFFKMVEGIIVHYGEFENWDSTIIPTIEINAALNLHNYDSSNPLATFVCEVDDNFDTTGLTDFEIIA